MSATRARIKLGWVALGVLLAVLLAMVVVTLVVTVYATYLGFEASGAPDPALIKDFASKTSAPLTVALIGIGALLGGLLAGRKAKSAAQENGLAVGIASGVVMVVVDFLSGPSLWSAAGLLLAVTGGWLGGEVAKGCI